MSKPHPYEEIFGRQLTRGEKAALTRTMNQYSRTLDALPSTDPRYLKHRRRNRELLKLGKELGLIK